VHRIFVGRGRKDEAAKGRLFLHAAERVSEKPEHKDFPTGAEHTRWDKIWSGTGY